MTACAQIQKERKREYCKEIAHFLNKDHECLLFSSAALGAGSTRVNKEVPTGVSRFQSWYHTGRENSCHVTQLNMWQSPGIKMQCDKGE